MASIDSRSCLDSTTETQSPRAILSAFVFWDDFESAKLQLSANGKPALTIDTETSAGFSSVYVDSTRNVIANFLDSCQFPDTQTVLIFNNESQELITQTWQSPSEQSFQQAWTVIHDFVAIVAKALQKLEAEDSAVEDLDAERDDFDGCTDVIIFFSFCMTLARTLGTDVDALQLFRDSKLRTAIQSGVIQRPEDLSALRTASKPKQRSV